MSSTNLIFLLLILILVQCMAAIFRDLGTWEALTDQIVIDDTRIDCFGSILDLLSGHGSLNFEKSLRNLFNIALISMFSRMLNINNSLFQTHLLLYTLLSN